MPRVGDRYFPYFPLLPVTFRYVPRFEHERSQLLQFGPHRSHIGGGGPLDRLRRYVRRRRWGTPLRAPPSVRRWPEGGRVKLPGPKPSAMKPPVAPPPEEEGAAGWARRWRCWARRSVARLREPAHPVRGEM